MAASAVSSALMVPSVPFKKKLHAGNAAGPLVVAEEVVTGRRFCARFLSSLVSFQDNMLRIGWHTTRQDREGRAMMRRRRTSGQCWFSPSEGGEAIVVVAAMAGGHGEQGELRRQRQNQQRSLMSRQASSQRRGGAASRQMT
jgi:hypothetical protein